MVNGEVERESSKSTSSSLPLFEQLQMRNSPLFASISILEKKQHAAPEDFAKIN